MSAGPNRCQDEAPPLQQVESIHYVLFENTRPPTDVKTTNETKNKSSAGSNQDLWKWDRDHVRMPCAPQNKYKWDEICKELRRKVKYTSDLTSIIAGYNPKYRGVWQFRGIDEFYDQNKELFRKTLPKIVHLALELPRLVTRPIPLLSQRGERSVSLTQQQIASLLANAFLCTFPWRNDTRHSQEYQHFPTINFNWLFREPKSSNVEKIKCLFHYFHRVADRPSHGVVTFIRRHVPASDLPKWGESTQPLAEVDATEKGSIEKDGWGMLQVDFANKSVGGGVLGNGCLQEEIRFITHPELIISRLFTEDLLDNEALVIIGSECYSRHSGYADTFSWAGDFVDTTPCDSSGRRRCAIVAMDATKYSDCHSQYEQGAILRELNKAYTGFSNTDVQSLTGVATGNWGCGAFNGDAQLKALIQLMAASQARRPLLKYFTFGDQNLARDFSKLCQHFKHKHFDVGKLFTMVTYYNFDLPRSMRLFQFILQQDNLDTGTHKKTGSSDIPPRALKPQRGQEHNQDSVAINLQREEQGVQWKANDNSAVGTIKQDVSAGATNAYSDVSSKMVDLLTGDDVNITSLDDHATANGATGQNGIPKGLVKSRSEVFHNLSLSTPDQQEQHMLQLKLKARNQNQCLMGDNETKDDQFQKKAPNQSSTYIDQSEPGGNGTTSRTRTPSAPYATDEDI